MKRVVSFFSAVSVMIALFIPFSFACGTAESGSNDDFGLIPAFPGADGAGKYTCGGRGGEIYHVTNLDDKGAGSFRDAVSKQGRMIVFDVGGTIELKSDISCCGNVTIMGQTAPGGSGITLKGGNIALDGDDIIMRFVRVFPAVNSKNNTAIGGSKGSKSIIDHCSVGFSNYEQVGISAKSIHKTVQYTIVGPGNAVSASTGITGYGAILGRGENSWHHNLFAHTSANNFRGKVDGTAGMDFVNNVIYDWSYGTSCGSYGHLNYVGNYLKGGPSTKRNFKLINIVSPMLPENFKFALKDNKIEVPGQDLSAINEDNWNGGVEYGSAGLSQEEYKWDIDADGFIPVLDYDQNNVSAADRAQSADAAFDTVTSYAGAAIDAEHRTELDKKLIEDTVNGTGSLVGRSDNGTDFTYFNQDLADNINDFNVQPMVFDNYYPESVPVKEITDSDNDGMPDEWESARGLDPHDPSDAIDDYCGRGYNNIEYYANDLAVNAFPKGTYEESPAHDDFGADFYKAKADADAIVFAEQITSASDLVLPENGAVNGSQINWVSGSDVFEIKDNKLVKYNQPVTEQLSVELVAVITNGTAKIKRMYTVNAAPSIKEWTAPEEATVFPADEELIPGLSPLIDMRSAVFEGNKSIIVNRQRYSSYITSAAPDNSTVGRWTDGRAEGCAFKYIPERDGYISAVISNLKEQSTSEPYRQAYIIEEKYAALMDCIGRVTGQYGDEQTILARVSAGKTYYIFTNNSNGRFSRFAYTSSAPDFVWKASADEASAQILMTGLSTAEAMSFKSANTIIGDRKFSGYIHGTENPGGDVRGETGAALHFFAFDDAKVTVYYSLGSGKTFRVTDAEGNIVSTYTNEAILNDEGKINLDSEYMYSTFNAEKWKTYYIYAKGSALRFYGVIVNLQPIEKDKSFVKPLYWKAKEAIDDTGQSLCDEEFGQLYAGVPQAYKGQEETIAGVDFPGYNTARDADTEDVHVYFENGSYRGAYFKYHTPPGGGASITVYAEVGAGKDLRIATIDSNGNEKIIKSYTADTKINTSLMATSIRGNTDYYFYINGSEKSRFYGVRFTPRVKGSNLPTPKPTLAPEQKLRVDDVSVNENGVCVTIENTAGENQNLRLLVASYNDDGSLKSVKMSNYNKISYKSNDLITGKVELKAAAPETERYKLMLWSDTAGMYPLMNCCGSGFIKCSNGL